MELLDDRGRLFGMVNVVDAFVAVFVLAVVVAGVLLVVGGGGGSEPTPTATRYATLDLGTQPDYLVDEIDAGDAYEPSSGTNLTVTDVYVAPQDDGVRVLLRVRLHGPATEGVLDYGGDPPRLGRELSIRTDAYQVAGVIRAVGERADLPVEETPVVLRMTLSPEQTRRVRVGDAVRLADHRVATIDDVAVYETNGSDRLAFVYATLRTYAADSPPRFGGTALIPGATVGLSLGGQTSQARVRAVGSEFTAGITEVLVTDVVSSAVAADVDRGDRYRVAGRDVASVERVTVYGTAAPDRKRVVVGLRLRTFSNGGVAQFGDIAVREGATVPFRTGAYDLAGTVRRVGTTELRGDPATRTVTLRMRNVSPDVADSVRTGLIEAAAGTTLARVTGVERDPSTVVLTSDDGHIYERSHPVNRDLTLTVDLAVRETAAGVTFKGRPLQQGTTVVLDLGVVTVDATVVSM